MPSDFVSLNDLTFQEIMEIHDNPFAPCPQCGGTGARGIMIISSGGMDVMVPMPCPMCEGIGKIPYVSMN